YWIGAIHEEQTVGDTIFRYALDSGVIDTLVHGPGLEPDPNHPRYFYYLAIDTVRRHIYWTDSGGTNSEEEVDIGAIMRASLDGDSTETILGGITCGLGGPSDIEIDVAGNTLYWGEASECYDYALNKVDLGSTPSEEWHLLPVSQGYVVEGIELDIHNQMIYWVTTDLFPDPPPGIVRALLDDTLNDEYILSGCVGEIALAHMLSKIYWSPCNSSQIMRADLDGSSIEGVVDGQGVIGNLAVDHRGGKLYWTEPAKGMIWRADLDGTEVENLLSGLVVPTSIALNFGWDVHVNVEPKTALPDRVGLRGIHPNPIREGATIDFAL